MSEPINPWNKAVHFENAASILEEGDERSFVRDTLQGLINEIAALRVENERLTQKSDAEMERVKACEHIAENLPGWEVLRNLCPSTAAVAGLQDRALQAEATAAAVVGALRNIGVQKTTEELTGDEYDAADFEGAYDTIIGVARSTLAAYHAEPISQSDSDKGMEKKTCL